MHTLTKDMSILTDIPDTTSLKTSHDADAGLMYEENSSRLFLGKLKDKSPEERYLMRNEKERKILDEFWNWLDAVNALNGSALGKAVTYARNQRPYLENYLKDGRLEISNNPAENAIRPFTVGRKNWLFSDTPKGADASAAVYSLIETAKANNLNVRMYLIYLLTNLPDTDWRNDPESLDDMMPWSDSCKAICQG